MAKVSSKALAGRLAKRLGMSVKKAEQLLAGVVEETVQALLDGDEVVIGGFVNLYAVDAPPKVKKDRKTGEQVVVPVRRRGRAQVAKALQERLALESRIAGAGILLAGEDDKFAADLEERLSRKQIRCHTARDFASGIKKAGRIKAVDFLVIAPSVAEKVYDDTVLKVKSQRASAFMPILRGLFDRGKLERPEGFKIIPDGIFSSPAEVVRQVAGDLERWREEKHYFKRQVRIRSSSDSPTVDRLTNALRRMASGSFKGSLESDKFLNAFPEAIENAAIHGNESSPDKYIDVTWLEDARRVVITVKDEGKGFDYNAALKTAESASAEVVRRHMERGKTTGGLGVKLLATAFDRVEYRANGTELVMTKLKG